MHNKLYLCLALIVAAIPGYRSECKITETQLDECMFGAMYFGNENAVIPSNDGEMDQHCNTLRTGIACLHEYSKSCMTGILQEASSALLDDVGKHMVKRCSDSGARAQFIKHSECFLPREKMTPLNICSHKFTKMAGIAVDMGVDGHIPGLCCAHHLTRQCVVNHMQAICGDAHSKYWDDFFDEVASEAIAIACAQFTHVEKCASMLDAGHWGKFTEIDKSNDPAVYHSGFKTPIKYILDIIKKYHT